MAQLPFGTQVKLARILRGVSQDQLAEAVSISNSMVYNVEHGFNVSPKLRAALINYLQIDEAFREGCARIGDSAVMTDGAE